MAPNDSSSILRKSVRYKPTYQRFVQKHKKYTQQYSHIYVSRLRLLRDKVLNHIQQATPSFPILSKIIDLRIQTPCIIIGTTLKILNAKPDLFEALTSDEKIISLSSSRLCLTTSQDSLILEDESGRVELIGNLNIKEMVTGVVMGVQGQMKSNGNNCFYVEQVFYPQFPPQVPLRKNPTQPSRYVALVSGLCMGRNKEINPLRNHILMDYLAGRLGNEQEKQFIAQIVRTIVVGNLVDTTTTSLEPLSSHKKKTTEELTLEASPMRNVDELLSTLACCMEIDVMPGDQDPSNHALPQQRFHDCLFPRSTRFTSFRTVTNPYQAQIDGIEFFGHSGQPLDSILQCTLNDEENNATIGLDCLERCLVWRHSAPTAPDVLSSFPIADDDPFVFETCPHVFFAGNQPEFSTRLVEGTNGQSVRIITVPTFTTTGTIVLVDLNDLSCFPIMIQA